MRNRCLIIVFLIFHISLLESCSVFFSSLAFIQAPEVVRKAALNYAQEYKSLGAIYEWGGQDPLPKTIKVDCSGLVVMCYSYACEDFGYRMPFQDMNAAGMQKYCDSVLPEPGDLIFMGDEGIISHVAIFKEIEGSNIHFIDSTTITGGVTERYYPIGSSKFISFGRLRIYK